jgi:hypothetical protein
MKTLKAPHLSDENRYEVTPKRGSAGILLKNVLVIVMFLCLTILPSCFGVIRTPRNDRHEVRNERHDRGDRHDHDEHHDNDDHHN